jgi:hypothetical protein
MPPLFTAPPGEIRWTYAVPPSTDAMMFLLTIGRIAMRGRWQGRMGEFFVAYCPMPKRDKALEEQLIAEGVIPR